MEMKLGQRLALTQSLLITPQLQQAIKLLQLSRLELIEEINHELEANPVLADEDIDPRPKEQEIGTRDTDSLPENGSGRDDALLDGSLRAEEKRARDVDWEQLLQNRDLQTATPATRGSAEELPSIEQTLSRPTSLRDHLMWQLQMNDFSTAERRFAELVIGNLDERGFLDLGGVQREDGTHEPDMTIEQLAEEAGLDPEDAYEVLKLIQQMDPLGVASRNLQECLRVQAEVYGFDELEMKIIDRHMGNLEKHNYQAIARDLKVENIEDIYEAAKEIQKLESRPGRNFSDIDERSIAISPDVYVVKKDGVWEVRDNDRGLQRLYVNKTLADRLKQNRGAKEFVSDKVRGAQWLIRAIDQRRKTIIRVTEAIVKRQQEFFEHGVSHLKPMILRDIAKDVGLHESTISRVTTNKHVHTPQGIFELKYFFNSSIRRTQEDDIAAESVKQAIRKLVDEEDKTNPLSDQAIVDYLSEKEHMIIARRTVAKYREGLGILASSRRKKLFLACKVCG